MIKTRTGNRNRTSSQSGFSLLETLVALALLSIIMAMLSAGLTAARQALQQLDRSRSVHDLSPAKSYLRSLLVHARPLPQGADPDHAPFSFDGSPTAAKLYSTFATGRQFDGLYMVEIAAEPASTEARPRQLIVRHTLFRPNGEEAGGIKAQETATVLVEDIERAAFSYYGADSASAAAEWHREWRHPDLLPRLVAIDVFFPPGSIRRWQRINLPIYMSGSTNAACPPRVLCR